MGDAMSFTNRKLIDALLIALIALDVFYPVVIFFFPESWFKFMHGATYVDPQGLLRRTAAVWTAFALFHFVTYLKWQKQPIWLAVSAGIRLSEIFADLTYVHFAQDMTWPGKIGLFMAGPTNALLGWYFLKSSFAFAEKSHEIH
jgi:hypothetical protein